MNSSGASTPSCTLFPRDHDAVLFDLDGVLTRTAIVHAAAWKRLFDEFLKKRSGALGEPFVPFDINTDYQRYVDGKPRYDGVRTFLKARGIELPQGAQEEGPDVQSVRAWAISKTSIFWNTSSRGGLSKSATAIFDKVMWAYRSAFFRDCRNIARWEVQCELAGALGVDIDAIEQSIHNGAAFARLAADYQDADKMRIEGSPSFVLNDGRQKLYGDVGFRIIEANIQELLRLPAGDQASWC